MAVVGALAVVWALVFEIFSRSGGASPSGRSGLEILGYFLLMFVLVEGVRNSAGGLCEERKDGTLGLLFLTDLSGLDVVMGKFSGAAIQAFFSLVAVVPVLGLAVLFGGVSGAELVRMVASLLAILALSLACGSWSSTRAKDGASAMLVGMGILLSVCLVPLVLDALLSVAGGVVVFPRFSVLGLASPLAAVALVADPPAGSGTSRFWISVALVVGQAVVWVQWAGWRLQRGWRSEGQGVAEAGISQAVSRAVRFGDGVDVLGPALSRHLSLPRWSRWLVRLTFLVAVGTAGMNLIPQWFPSFGPLLYLPIGLMSLTRSFLLIWQATRAFGEWRRSGELEILLTTAVPEREIVRRGWDQFRPVLVRMFVVGAVASGVMTALSRTFQTMASPSPAPPQWNFVLYWVGQEITEAAQWWALVWVGFWMGLRNRRMGLAIGKTFGIVVASNFFLVMFLQLGMTHWRSRGPGTALWVYLVVAMSSFAARWGLSWAWVHWARHQLFNRFRTVAARDAGL